MAERRMFAKSIIDSDAFLEMPMSARLLYYDLGMRADDEGFVNSPKKIMKMIGASVDDLNILAFRHFVIPSDDGIVVIKHWRINNYLRSDRFKPTNYREIRGKLYLDSAGIYHVKDQVGIPDGIPEVYPGKDRIGEGRIGEDRIGEDRIEGSEIPMYVPEVGDDDSAPMENRERINYQEIVDRYNETCPSLSKVMAISEQRKKAIRARVKQYGRDQIFDAFRLAEQSSFLKGGNKSNWSADFDWIMRDGNIPKILEGKYSDRASTDPGQPATKAAAELDAAYDMMDRWAQEG